MFYILGMNRTTQILNTSEKVKEFISLKIKKDNDIILYWHYETIKEDLLNEYLKEIFA